MVTNGQTNRTYLLTIDAGASKRGAEMFRQATATIQAASQAAADAPKKIEVSAARALKTYENWSNRADPVARAQRAMARDINVVAQAFEQQHISLEQAENDVAGIMLRYDEGARAAKAFADANRQIQAELSRNNAQTDFNRFMGVGAAPPGGAKASAAVFEESARAADELAASQAKAAASAQMLLERADPLVAAQRIYTQNVTEADAALAASNLTAEQHQRILIAERRALDQARIASAQLTGTWKLQGWQARNLSMQVNDVVSSLAMGMPPQQVLLQQGGQIIQIFDISAKTLVTYGLAVAGVAVAVGGLTAAYLKGIGQTEEFNRVTLATANAAGLTASSLDALAASASAGAGNGRALAMEAAATGKINVDAIQALIDIQADYAAATDQSASEAGSALVKMFVDPKKALEELDEAYNLLTDAQRRSIREMIAHGDRTGAQIALTDALNLRFEGTSDKLGFLDRKLRDLARGWNIFWDAAAGIGRQETLDEQIAALEQRIAGLAGRAGARGINANLAAGLLAQLQQLLIRRDIESQRAGLSGQIDDLRLLDKEFGDFNRSQSQFLQRQKELQDQIEKSDAAIVSFNEQLMTAARIGSDEQFNELSAGLKSAEASAQAARDALAALRSPLDESVDRLRIAQQLAGATPAGRGPLQAYLNAFDQASNSADSFARDNAEAIARAAATQATVEQTMAIMDQNREMGLNTALTLETAEAALESGAAHVRAAAEQQAALDALQLPIERAARAQIYLNKAVADSILAGAQQVRSLQEQARAQEFMAEAAGIGPNAERAAGLNARIADATRGLRDALQNATGEEAASLRAQIESITDALVQMDAAARQIDVSRAFRGQDEQLERLNLQLQLITATNRERAVSVARLQAEIEARTLFTEAQQREREEYIETAVAVAGLAHEVSRLERVQQFLGNVFEQSFDRIGSAITEATATGRMEFAKFRDVGLAVLSEIEQAAFRLAFINPIKNWLTGGDDPVLGDIIGKGVDWLFGSSSTPGLSPSPTGIGGPQFNFADGGVMTPGGPLPLRRYRRGGIANSPQLALYGEGDMSEAYVPLPDGRSIPVTISVPDWATRVPPANSNAASGTVVNIIDQRSAGNSEPVETRRRQGAGGMEEIDVILKDRVDKAIQQGRFDSSLGNRFDLIERPKERRG